MKQPNRSARIGVKPLLGGAGAVMKNRKLSAWIGVMSLLGGAGAILRQPSLSARIGAKSLLEGAGATVKQPSLSTRIGVKSLLGGAGAILIFEARKPVCQDWGKVVSQQTSTFQLSKMGKPVEEFTRVCQLFNRMDFQCRKRQGE